MSTSSRLSFTQYLSLGTARVSVCICRISLADYARRIEGGEGVSELLSEKSHLFVASRESWQRERGADFLLCGLFAWDDICLRQSTEDVLQAQHAAMSDNRETIANLLEHIAALQPSHHSEKLWKFVKSRPEKRYLFDLKNEDLFVSSLFLLWIFNCVCFSL